MSSWNPYEPPATESVLEESDPPRILVDGRNLVIGSGTELPRRCIKTNQPVSENNVVSQTLAWHGRTFQFMISSKQCTVVWYATSRVTWELFIRRTAGILACPTIIVPIFFLAEDRIWPNVMLGFAIIMLSLLVIMKQPLRVVDYRRNRFWIKGCCPEFLESLKSELPDEQ